MCCLMVVSLLLMTVVVDFVQRLLPITNQIVRCGIDADPSRDVTRR